jgi:hypothetical protein
MDTKQFKKILRSIKMPSGAEVYDTSAHWKKRGGHAGKNAIIRVAESARDAGFVLADAASSSTPDGARVGSGTRYVKDNITIILSSSYGVTAYDNRFSIDVYVS